VSFVEKVEESGGSSSASPKVQKQILEKADKFSVLLPSNLPQLVVPEFAPLINPFFFQDRHHTFYVEPTLTEQTFLEWQDWIVPVVGPDLDFDVPITASDPEWLDPGGPVEFDPLSIYEFGDNFDWATSPGTLLQFGDAWVSGGGGVNVQQLPAMSTSAFEMFADTSGGIRPSMIDGSGLNSVSLKGMNVGGQLGAQKGFGG
ncbi:MAG: hypothetical protein ACJ74T_09055, partial [Pyrinomonadaceae bacterium]